MLLHTWLCFPGAVVFDLFRVWRLDSGKFEDIADVVISAWEKRHMAGGSAERPLLMHSNLSDIDEVECMCRSDHVALPCCNKNILLVLVNYHAL